MRCFVINLLQKKERYEFMARQLSEMSISFERFDAIDPSKLDVKEKENLYDRESVIKRYKKEFTNGELGCALSHRAIYQKIVDENIPLSFILEDDILFDQAQFQKLFNKIPYTPPRWEYLALNYDIFDKNFRDFFFQKTLSGSPLKKFVYAPLMYLYMPIEMIQQNIGKYLGPTILPQLRPLHLCGAYFITLEGAKKLLKHATPIRYPADYLQNQARLKSGLKTYFVAPQILRQYNEVFGSSTRK